MSRFEAVGHTVYQADDDADTDTLVVQKALQLDVTVIANVTDILVLLLYHYHLNMDDVFMHTESSKHLISIRALYLALGQSVVKQLLAIHAISGCDTTSGLYQG